MYTYTLSKSIESMDCYNLLSLLLVVQGFLTSDSLPINPGHKHLYRILRSTNQKPSLDIKKVYIGGRRCRDSSGNGYSDRVTELCNATICRPPQIVSEAFVCSQECINNGVRQNGKCVCPVGFHGDFCEKREYCCAYACIL